MLFLCIYKISEAEIEANFSSKSTSKKKDKINKVLLQYVIKGAFPVRSFGQCEMLVASLVTSGRSIDQYSPDAVESIKITEFEKQKLIRLMAGDFLIKKIPMKYKKPFIEREFLIQKKVAHKNVVRVYHTHENMIFMEYVKGFNLLYRPQFWTKNKRIFAYIFKEIAEGIKFMHDKGVVHGDLKPCNILVSEEGDIKICDFGSSVEINRVNAKGATRTEGTDSDKMPYSKEEYDLSFTRQFVAPEFIKPDSVSPEEFMLTLIQKKKTNPKWKALKSGQLKFRLKDDQFPTKESDVFSFAATFVRFFVNTPGARYDHNYFAFESEAQKGDKKGPQQYNDVFNIIENLDFDLAYMIDDALDRSPEVRPTIEKLLEYLKNVGCCTKDEFKRLAAKIKGPQMTPYL